VFPDVYTIVEGFAGGSFRTMEVTGTLVEGVAGASADVTGIIVRDLSGGSIYVYGIVWDLSGGSIFIIGIIVIVATDPRGRAAAALGDKYLELRDKSPRNLAAPGVGKC
jgi:hypothetical protein